LFNPLLDAKDEINSNQDQWRHARVCKAQPVRDSMFDIDIQELDALCGPLASLAE
jgi:hypothetical protein